MRLVYPAPVHQVIRKREEGGENVGDDGDSDGRNSRYNIRNDKCKFAM